MTHTSTEQPEALANEYRSSMPKVVLHLWAQEAVLELRRQHARILELEAEKARLIEVYVRCPSAIEAYMYGITQEKQG